MYRNKIREIRKALNISQEELANSVGVNRATISKYESGAISPTLAILSTIAASLDVSVADLLGVKPSEQLEKLKKNFPDAPVNIVDGKPQITLVKSNVIYSGSRSDIIKKRVKAAMDKLNDNGQEVAAERIEELTKIPEYQKDISED